MEPEMIENNGRLGKDELMERIKTRCASELKDNKNLIYFWLVILAIDILYCAFGNSSDWGTCGFPALVVFGSSIEAWWMNKMIQCGDAWSLVTTYTKYKKIGKLLTAIAFVLCLLLLYYFYHESLRYGTKALVMMVVFGVAALCYFLWILFFKKKSLTELDVKHLRELIP